MNQASWILGTVKPSRGPNTVWGRGKGRPPGKAPEGRRQVGRGGGVPGAEAAACAKAWSPGCPAQEAQQPPRLSRTDSVSVSEATPATSLGTNVATECGFNGESWPRWIVPPPPGKGPPDSPC